MNNDKIFIIKVHDFVNEIVCRYNKEEDHYYIQRGDGRILQIYNSYRVEYKKELIVYEEI